MLVAGVALVKAVAGLTVEGAPFTLYLAAVAASAARGGLAPAIVATLGSLLAGALTAAVPVDVAARLLFALEGLSVALIVAAIQSRLRASEARAASAETTIAELRLRDRHGYLLDAALRHLEDVAGDTAVVVLDAAGKIAEWRTSAERLYGYSAEQVAGVPAASLSSGGTSAGDASVPLKRAATKGGLRRTEVHRRQDGDPVEVDLEIRPVGEGAANGFTWIAHDTARRREWDEYRQAAGCAQAALQQAADETRQRLTALESLTDPELNPLGGPVMVAELLERLRTTVGADAAALVRPGPPQAGVVAAGPLHPLGPGVRAEAPRLAAGRVAVVHNDPAQVERQSAVRWPRGVTSLLVVPVVHDRQVWSTIEVVSERSRRVSDWDVALARIVADRLAPVVTCAPGPAATAS